MSTTLSNGYKLPDNGDKGASLFADLEANIQRVNDHDHDGTDSSRLPTSSLNHTTQSILAVNWALVGNGIYRQSVTTTGSLEQDSYGIVFIDSSGKRYMLETEAITTTSYYVYCNDNTLDLTAIYV